MSTDHTDHLAILQARVEQFQMLQLPGQPQEMHMGTSYLVTDLWHEVKRLHEGPAALRSPESTPDTTKVRIALIINNKGEWSAAGWSSAGEDEAAMFCCAATDMPDAEGEALQEHHLFITAEVPVPQTTEVVGTIERVQVQG